MVPPMTMNKIVQSYKILKKRHYIRKAKPKNDYWVSFYAHILEEYISKFGDNFSLIIYGDEDIEYDFYAIKYPTIKSLLTQQNYDPNYRRWILTIHQGEMRVHGGSERLDVSPFHGDDQIFSDLIEKSREFSIEQRALIQTLKSGDVISNEELCKIFGCSPQGGMRRGSRTNSLVLISDHTKSLYDDRWIGEILHYTGMGLKGDQDVKFAQNKTLIESNSNGVDVYLFELFSPKKYTYTGQVELADSPYWEIQEDIEKNPRKVIIFPLKLKEDVKKAPISQAILMELQQEQERKAGRLSIDELEIRAKSVRGPASQRAAVTTTFSRNPYVSAFAKVRADGVCQLCQKPAPFIDKNHDPYLETHHILWLSEGGEDSLQNTVALCPNCHKKMHILNLGEDKDRLFHAMEGS